jgi:hypothetical protein
MVSFEEIPEEKVGVPSTAEEIPKSETVPKVETDDNVDADDSWEELMGKDLIMKVSFLRCISCNKLLTGNFLPFSNTHCISFFILVSCYYLGDRRGRFSR